MVSYVINIAFCEIFFFVELLIFHVFIFSYQVYKPTKKGPQIHNQSKVYMYVIDFGILKLKSTVLSYHVFF